MFKPKPLIKYMALASAAAVLAACNGDDGDNGTNGRNGQTSLIDQVTLEPGHTSCFNGGVAIQSGLDTNNDGTLADTEVEETMYVCNSDSLNEDMNFVRIASLPVCKQLDATCDTDEETAAEIVAVSGDGMTLVYTDSPQELLGFADISSPAKPAVAGTLALEGEPTSVAVKEDYALVGVNTSEDFVNVSGHLAVVQISTQTSLTTIDLGGQPDSVAISPDQNFLAIAIENERDEDLNDGVIPQEPAGSLVIVDISDASPDNWTTTTVDLTGTSALYATDPEPEYVDINENNIAVVTLQENNHIVLVDLTTGEVVNEFTAGSVDLTNIDTEEEDPAIINPTGSQEGRLREPDGVSWINTEYFATADEGDLDGGSRGFTIFNTAGEVVWHSGSELDHMAIRFGHYPDGRSGNKGNEPENIEMGIYGDNRYLFVNSERSSLVFVYDVADPTNPVFKQVLPAGVGPEGGLAIPSRNLLVVASEKDDRGDKIRSVLNIYDYNLQASVYPSIQSANRENGTPIPWSAMSGLSSDPYEADVLYAVEDSFYASNRIFKIDISSTPATLSEEITIKDTNDVFAGFPTAGTEANPDAFDAVDLAAMINEDKTVNIDPEGIAKASDGGFWVASEGAGTYVAGSNPAQVARNDEGEPVRPIEKLNFIFKTDAYGVIEQVITLPQEVNDLQIRFGFEGIAEYDGKAYVAFQRAWGSEANPRIGIFDATSETWTFVHYPLDIRESQNGGWVGLSDITTIGNGEFLVLERDNKGGPDAAVKRLYKIDLSDVENGQTITKTLVRDIAADLSSQGNLTFEKVEGSALMANGDVYIINDNDGVDDNSGETQLLNLGPVLEGFTTETISIEKIGTFGRTDDASTFDESAAEIVDFHPASEQAFVVNANTSTVDVLDMSNPSAPALVQSLDVAGAVEADFDSLTDGDLGAANSVSVSGDFLAVAIEADDKQANGYVAFFNVNGTYLSAAEVGALPDMVTFTPDGTKVLTANEGEPSDDYTNDPEGSVSVIDVSGGVASVAQSDVATVSFVEFNEGGARADELDSDVRIASYAESVAQDLEPEYIAVSADSSTAWVAMQENNALGIIDLTDNSVTSLVGLGYKNHSVFGNELDASNRDDAINIQAWPVRGLYMPDTIDAYEFNGTTYIVTANEGDSREYDDIVDEIRVKDINGDFGATINLANITDFAADADELDEDENLGRIKVISNAGITDEACLSADAQPTNACEYTSLYSFGARSFSIWNGTTGALVFDSGSDMERITAKMLGEEFNATNDENGGDNRSDDKGPEPEAIEIATIRGKTYAFIGLERVGGIMVYDISNPAAAQFVQYVNPRDFSQDIEALVDAGDFTAAGDLGPESIKFVSAEDSPSGEMLLIVGNEVSGTTAVYKVSSVITE